MMNIQPNQIQKENESEDIASMFSLYISNEPGSRLPFTGAAVNVGRISSFATTTCSKLSSTPSIE